MSTPKLTAALIEARKKMGPLIKTSENPHFKSRFADLASVYDVSDDALAEHGLVVMQTTAVRDAGTVLITKLKHVSGEEEQGEYPLIPAKDRDPQALRACMTYGRRTTIEAILGLAPEDDDGNEASRKSEPKKTEAQRTIADVKAAHAKPAEHVDPKTGEVTKADTPLAAQLIAALNAIQNGAHLENWGKKHADEIHTLSAEQQKQINEQFLARRKVLANGNQKGKQ